MMNSDDQFLQHFERLSNAQAEAEREHTRLVSSLATAKQRLKQIEGERDEAGRLGALSASDRFAQQSTQFEQANMRRNLEAKLNDLLLELVSLEFPANGLLPNDTVTLLMEQLKETQARLVEGARYFDSQLQHPQLQQQQQQPAPQVRFELERARRKLQSVKHELNEVNERVRLALQNETNLREKISVEQRRNESMGRQEM